MKAATQAISETRKSAGFFSLGSCIWLESQSNPRQPSPCAVLGLSMIVSG
jgi:hypothetical protein